jgi:hypothetical protein
MSLDPVHSTLGFCQAQPFAHRELSVALVQSQGYVYRTYALLLAKVSE